MSKNTSDHPTHYNNFKAIGEDGTAVYEPIKVMDQLYMGYGFYFGSALKYIARAPHKGQMISDYKKALFCIKRLDLISRPKDERLDLLKEAVIDWDVPGEISEVLPSVWLGESAIAIESLSAFIEKLEEEEANNG